MLSGVRVVVTRAAHQAGELTQSLEQLGAIVLPLPLIAIAPPLDSEPLRRAAAHADDYDWIIFTSANAVAAFAAERKTQSSLRATVAAIGNATRAAAEQHGFPVSLMPAQFVAESLVEALGSQDLTGRRILIPAAAVTRGVVPDELRRRGAHVDVVEAYRNITPPEAAAEAARIFRDPYPDWVLFASSSAVDHLIELVGPEALQQTRIASIGPITSATVRRHGLTVAAEAETQSASALISALCAAHSGSPH